MARTRANIGTNQQENEQQLENPADDSLALDIEDLPEHNDETVPPNIIENSQIQPQSQNQPNSQNQGSNSIETQMLTQVHAEEEIANWVKSEFQKATEGNTDAEKEQHTSILL